MPPNKPLGSRLDQVVADAIRNRQSREAGYREQALKIYPWICGRCAREFVRENLQQLPCITRITTTTTTRRMAATGNCCVCIATTTSIRGNVTPKRHARRSRSRTKAEVNRATAQPFANLKDLLSKSSSEHGVLRPGGNQIKQVLEEIVR